MSAYDESLHPRGQAANAGQFKAKENTAPSGDLAAPRRAEPYSVVWDGNENVMIAAETNPWLAGADGAPVALGGTQTAQLTRDLLGDDCECEDGPMSGVLVGMDSPDGIQRCDSCQRFDSDLHAARALAQATNAQDGGDLQVRFIPAPDPASGRVTRRTDGRLEVTDEAGANAAYGCRIDDWCILADGHDGDCDEDRESWEGPDELYPVELSPEVRLAEYLAPRPEDYAEAEAMGGNADVIARLRAAGRMFEDGHAHPGDADFERIWTTGEGGYGEATCRRHLAEYQELRTQLAAGTIAPRDIIGTGYRGNTRKLANDYIDQQEATYERAIATRGRSLPLNASNVDYRRRRAAN